jgi:hypothetical protein
VFRLVTIMSSGIVHADKTTGNSPGQHVTVGQCCFDEDSADTKDSGLYSIMSNRRFIGKNLIGKDLEGRGCGLIEIFQALVWRD